MRTLLRLPGRTQASVIAFTLLVGSTLAVRGAVGSDADLQLQLATLLYDETRYQEALQAFDQAAQADDPGIAVRARKGSVRTSLKVAEFGKARREAETLRKLAPSDTEAIALVWRRVLVGRTLRLKPIAPIATGSRSRRSLRARGSASRARSPPRAVSMKPSIWRSPRRPARRATATSTR
jgi:tetratricopeptide (TPR) repeat protein